MRPPSSPILDPFSYSHPYIHQEVREYALSPWYLVYLTGWSVLSNLTDVSVNNSFSQTHSLTELSPELEIPSQVLILNSSIIKAASTNISVKPQLSRNEQNSNQRKTSKETSRSEKIRQEEQKILQNTNHEFLSLELAQKVPKNKLKNSFNLSNNATMKWDVKSSPIDEEAEGNFLVAGQDTSRNIQNGRFETAMNTAGSHLSVKILESLCHSLHLHRKLNVRVNSVNSSLEGTAFNISFKRPLSLDLHKKMLKITSLLIGGKRVSVVVKSGFVEHVYVNLEKVQPPNRLVMFISFGLGFLGIGGSVLVMVYLGTRMVAINSAEDSKHLLENQCDEEEDESDVFLGPNPPKPHLQISIISNKDEKRAKGQKKPTPAILVDEQEPVFQVFEQEDKKFDLQAKFETIGM